MELDIVNGGLTCMPDEPSVAQRPVTISELSEFGVTEPALITDADVEVAPFCKSNGDDLDPLNAATCKVPKVFPPGAVTVNV
jgi:hypothetical protein